VGRELPKGAARLPAALRRLGRPARRLLRRDQDARRGERDVSRLPEGGGARGAAAAVSQDRHLAPGADEPSRLLLQHEVAGADLQQAHPNPHPNTHHSTLAPTTTPDSNPNPTQVEICGKLTWTRNDCYNGITSPRVINENNVAVKQRQAAMAVWNRCNVDKKGLDHTCLANDFKKKLTDKVEDEVTRTGRNLDPDPDPDPDLDLDPDPGPGPGPGPDPDSDPDPGPEPNPNPDPVTI